jgi:hypothetical protein
MTFFIPSSSVPWLKQPAAHTILVIALKQKVEASKQNFLPPAGKLWTNSVRQNSLRCAFTCVVEEEWCNLRQNAELLNLRKTSYESGSIVARKTAPVSSAPGEKKSVAPFTVKMRKTFVLLRKKQPHHPNCLYTQRHLCDTSARQHPKIFRCSFRSISAPR